MYHRALKLIRNYHDLSQVEAADKLGFSKSYVSELEKGTKKPSIDVLEQYARVFGLPLSQLMVFAETSSGGGFRGNVRRAAARKVLKMLEWVERQTQNKAA